MDIACTNKHKVWLDQSLDEPLFLGNNVLLRCRLIMITIDSNDPVVLVGKDKPQLTRLENGMEKAIYICQF